MTEQTISAAMPYESRFVTVAGSRIHYVEAGEGDPVLFLHGNPTSCYLWRNVMPHLAGEARSVAMDLVGMGRSDKPDLEYRLVDHARYVDGFIEALGLRRLTLVLHDWGSALGFHYARRHAANVRGLAFMEAIVRPMGWDEWPHTVRPLFEQFRTPEVGWKLVVERNAFVEQVLPGAIQRTLSGEEMGATASRSASRRVAGRSGAGPTRFRSTASRRTCTRSSGTTRRGLPGPTSRSCSCTRGRAPSCGRTRLPGAGSACRI